MNVVRPKQINPPQFVFSIVMIFAYLGWAFWRAKTQAIDSPIEHIDGAFQTASGLFRLHAGQAPGRDFLPYLGIGPLLTLWPMFEAMGANLAASAVAAHAMVYVTGGLCASIGIHLLRRSPSVLSSCALGALTYALPLVVAETLDLKLHHALDFMRQTGPSLRPIRACIPYVMGAAMFSIFRLGARPLVRAPLLGGALGVSLLWSNDYAIPTFGLMLVFATYHERRQLGRMPWHVVVAAALGLGLGTALLMIVTRGHLHELLSYNFRDVAADQWWIFPDFRDKYRVYGLREIPKLIGGDNKYPLVVLAISVWTAWRRPGRTGLLVNVFIGTCLCAGGTLASVGGHLDEYYRPMNYWAIVTTIGTIVRLIEGAVTRAGRAGRVSTALRRHVLGASGAIAMSAVALTIFVNYRTLRSEASRDPNRFFVPELGAHLPTTWQAYVDLARRTPPRIVVEEYWGIWSALRGSFPIWPVDSTIHALGHVREVAREALRAAQMVITTRAEGKNFPGWNLNQTPWFYDELLMNWDVRERGPMTVVWSRRSSPRAWTPVACEVDRSERTIVIRNGRPGYFRIWFKYAFHGGGRHLLRVQTNLALGDFFGAGYASLNPRGGEVPIFAAVPRAGPTTLRTFWTNGNEDALDFVSCEAGEIDFPQHGVLPTLKRIP